jgi:hypothetical protein
MLIALDIIHTKITTTTIKIAHENKSTLISEIINQRSIKTKELAMNAKNPQNFSIYSQTFGLILYLQ